MVVTNGVELYHAPPSDMWKVDSEPTDDIKRISGVALRYGSIAEDRYVSFQSGCFSNSIQKSNVMSFFGHDSNQVLGSMKAGTLEMRDMEDRLEVSIEMPNTTLGRDVYELVKRGDIAGMSVGVVRREQEEADHGMCVTNADLIEVSVVSMPAFADTTAEAHQKCIKRVNNTLATMMTKLDDSKRKIDLLTFHLQQQR